MAAAAVVLGVVVLSVVFGLIAVSANPIFIAFAVAMLVGPMLLLRPAWMVWFVLVGGLMVAGVVPLWFEGAGNKAVWGISLLSFLLMALALVRALTSRDVRAGTPSFVWVMLVFMFFALFSAVVNGVTAYELLSGFKRYFQGFGLVLALVWLGFGAAQMQQWSRFFVVLALLQLPLAIYERVHFVPIREGLARVLPNMVPIDVVAGTFGAGLYGGGSSAVLAAFLVILLGFLIAYSREGLIRQRRLWLLVPLVLSPLFLGETKIVVVILPLIFVVLFWRQILARPIVGVVGLAAGALLTVAAGFTYLQISAKKVSLEDRITDTVAYNFKDRGYGSYKLNRSTVLTFWARQQSAKEPVSLVLGNGLGSAHEVTGGHLTRRYPNYGLGLTTVSALLWEQGLIGTLLYLAGWAMAFVTAIRLRRTARDPLERADLSGLIAGLAVVGLYMLYVDAPLQSLSYQIFTGVMFGRLAWLHRQRVLAPSISAV